MFKERPANKRALSTRRPIHNVGINDVSYYTQYKDNLGTPYICPYYKVWKSMIGRCYDKKIQSKHPTYLNCSTSLEWIYLSKFKMWMKSQDWEGKVIDKDILIPGNKIYSSDTCMFVDNDINLLIAGPTSKDRYGKIGSNYRKERNKYLSNISIYGKKKFLGYFETEDQANETYLKAKSFHIRDVAEKYRNDICLYNALLNHAELTLKG